MEPLELFARRQVLTVSELVNSLKKLAEERFDFVWVEGEISGLRRPGSGHAYFSLKDDQALLRAVLFRPQASLMRFALEEGQRVLCQGRLTVYPPRGDVQLVVDTIEPRGAGALALAFAQLRRRLQAEGLFDEARKRPLPDMPQRVAVVTSQSGAAIRDFLNVLHRRFDRVSVAVYPVPVQGDEAAPRMVSALKDLAAWGWPEVIVLTRGGGSPEDLWAFNDEALARAIAASPIPVVSAVGHEVDVSISDLVADLRAATPSAAAELLVRPRADLAHRLRFLRERLTRAGQAQVARRREVLAGLKRGLGDPSRRLIDKRLRVEDLLSRAGHAARAALHRRERELARAREGLLAQRPDRHVVALQARRDALARRLALAGAEALRRRRTGLRELEARLRALSPLAVLGRGYALVRDEAGKVVRRAASLAPGQAVAVRLQEGSLRARVEEVLP
jgi:exodeoxyribonuclease VII large subunit